MYFLKCFDCWVLLGCLAFIWLFSWLLFKKDDTQFPVVKMRLPKAILNLSFWGCGIFCIMTLEKNVCLTCMQSFLGRTLNEIYDTSFMGMVKLHVRFCVILVLVFLWLSAMMLKKKGKKC